MADFGQHPVRRPQAPARGMRFWLTLAGISGAVAVTVGAYGHHTFNAGDAMRDVFAIGVQYQMWHTLALIGIALLVDRFPGSRFFRLAGACFGLGIALFSGTLYLLALTGERLFEDSAPIGGFVLIAGWLLLLWGGLKAGRD